MLLFVVMVLRCAHCRSKFQVDDALRGKTFRCRVCASPIKAEPKPSEDPALAATAPAISAVPDKRSSVAPRASTAPRASAAPASRRPEPSPASVNAAVVRRNNDERSKRDLFGQELQLSARVVEHESAQSPFTAARNENSVLFSLDQLSKPRVPQTVTSGASSAPAASAAASAGPMREKADSGLIDLNALMVKPLDAKSIRPAPLSEPPLGAFTREVEDRPSANEVMVVPAFRGKKKTPIFAAAGAAALALFVGIGLVAANREDARVEAAAKAAAAPPPQAPTTVVAEPTPAPAPVAAAEPPAETKETKASSSGKHGARKSSSRGGKASSAPAADKPAAPKKPADPCGCKGDLLCNMKCSSK